MQKTHPVVLVLVRAASDSSPWHKAGKNWRTAVEYAVCVTIALLCSFWIMGGFSR